MITKEDVLKVQATANTIFGDVANLIRELTKENPLVLFDKDKLNQEDGISSDEVYDFPYGYYVGKYEEYFSGVVMKVTGNDVELFLTDDEYGKIWNLDVTDLPFSSQVDLLSYLIERM